MRVLLAQLDPRAGDAEANAATVAVSLADHPQADLAVFPELFLQGYDPDRAGELALAADDEPLPWLRALAARHGTALIVGFAERVRGGGVANAVACIDRDGRHVGTYRKTHLFGAAERSVFAAGGALRVVELAGRRVAPLICFDAEFPEPARAVAQAGAELLVTVAANMEPYGPDHALAIRARALDNRLPHVYVNRVGVESERRFVGGSAVVGPGGELLAQLGQQPALELVELPSGARTHPNEVDYLEHVRDDLVVEGASSTSLREGSG